MVWWGVSAVVVSPNRDDMGEKATPQESRVGKRKLGSGVTKSLGQKEAMAAGAGLFPPKRPRRPAMKHSETDAGAKGAQASESHLLENGVSFPCGRRAPNRFAKVHICKFVATCHDASQLLRPGSVVRSPLVMGRRSAK